MGIICIPRTLRLRKASAQGATLYLYYFVSILSGAGMNPTLKLV